MALKRDFTSFVGEDIRLRVTLRPVPAGGISGWTFEFTARQPKGAASAFITHLDADFTIEDADLAIFYVPIADTETDVAGLVNGLYDYDIKRIDAGSEAVLVYGVWTLDMTPTRDEDS